MQCKQIGTGRGTSQRLSQAKMPVSKHLVLTHLIPPLGANRQGPYPIPGGGLSETDYSDAVEKGGFTGNVIVGQDLSRLRLTLK